MSLSQTWPCLAWLAVSHKKDPSALNTTVTQVTGDTPRSTYCPCLPQPSPGSPIFRQRMSSTSQMEGDHWLAWSTARAGCLPEMGVSRGDKSPAPTQGRAPCVPTLSPAATAPPGTAPGCDWFRRMLLCVFLLSVDVASTKHGCGQPGSRAPAALRSRTVPGLGSAITPTRAWHGGITLGKLPGSDHSLVGCPQ